MNRHDLALMRFARPLFEVIAKGEVGSVKYKSANAYSVIYGSSEPELTNMSLQDVLDLQKDMVDEGSPSSAMGKFQIINKTLKGLIKKLGLPLDTKFTPELQDRLALQLLKSRGFEDFLNGNISRTEFMRNLSMEWASLPKDKTGLSYYHGDGLNKSHILPNEIRSAMRKSKYISSSFLGKVFYASTGLFEDAIDATTNSTRTAITAISDNLSTSRMSQSDQQKVLVSMLSKAPTPTFRPERKDIPAEDFLSETFSSIAEGFLRSSFHLLGSLTGLRTHWYGETQVKPGDTLMGLTKEFFPHLSGENLKSMAHQVASRNGILDMNKITTGRLIAMYP